MKLFFLGIMLLLLKPATAQEDYNLQVNDTIINIALDKKYDLTVNGQKITLKVSSKDTLVYNAGAYSFKYFKDLKVSKTTVAEGVEQIAILTAEGSGFLIQKYDNIDPSKLNEMMLNEVTKESISYGFESKRTDYKRKLRSGQNIDVNKMFLKYKDDINIYEVGSLGKKDSGIIIMTIRMDEDDKTNGNQAIELLWNSLEFN